MIFAENIKKKIAADFLVKKIEISLTPEEGYSKIDKNSVKILLEICGYQNVSKRGIELFVKENENHVIVNDALLGRYETDINDVVLRKAPLLKEMLSFKNARKILGDSDVLKSVKKETLDYLRQNYIQSLDFSLNEKSRLLSEAKILFEADDFEGFFKLLLVFFELGSLKYIPFLSKKYSLYIFGEKFQKENDSFFKSIGLLDKKNKKFLFANNEIKEEKISGILSGKIEEKVFSQDFDALVLIEKIVEDLEKYQPLENNMFFYGLPEDFKL